MIEFMKLNLKWQKFWSSTREDQCALFQTNPPYLKISRVLKKEKFFPNSFSFSLHIHLTSPAALLFFLVSDHLCIIFFAYNFCDYAKSKENKREKKI